MMATFYWLEDEMISRMMPKANDTGRQWKAFDRQEEIVLKATIMLHKDPTFARSMKRDRTPGQIV